MWRPQHYRQASPFLTSPPRTYISSSPSKKTSAGSPFMAPLHEVPSKRHHHGTSSTASNTFLNPQQHSPIARGNGVIPRNFSDESYSQLSSPLRKERGRRGKYGTSLSKGAAACGADGRVKQIKAPLCIPFFSVNKSVGRLG